jgi:transposase
MPSPYQYNRPSKERSQASTPECVINLFAKIKGGATVNNSLLNLEGWQDLFSKETGHEVVIYAATATKPKQCNDCGAPASMLNPWGYCELAFFYDSPIRAKRTRLYYRAQRFRCANKLDDGRKCGHTTRQPLPEIDERRGATRRLVEYIEREAFRPTRTILSLSEETGVPESSIRNIFTDRAIQLEAQRVVEPLRWLAIDEVNIPKKVYKQACCVLFDPVKNIPIDILEDNKQDTLARALLSLFGQARHDIEVISIDFWPGYLGVRNRVLKDIPIVIDRRHAQEIVRRAFQAFIQDLYENKGKRWCRANMHNPSPLYKRHHELSEVKETGQDLSEKEFIDQWLEQIPELKVGYWLKEEFCNLYELSSSQEALQRYDEWEVRAKAASPAFHSVAHTVQHWRSMVFGYNDFKDRFPKRVTNGSSEAANKIIKRVRRLCVGIDRETLRAKLILGEFFVVRRPPHPLDTTPTTKRPVEADDKVRKPKGKKKQPGPNANTERLRRAREARDKTEGLIESPLKNQDFVKRVKHLEQHGVTLGKSAEENSTQAGQMRRGKSSGKKSVFKAAKPSSTTSPDSKQLKMF